jgi:hypothetical protein
MKFITVRTVQGLDLRVNTAFISHYAPDERPGSQAETLLVMEQADRPFELLTTCEEVDALIRGSEMDIACKDDPGAIATARQVDLVSLLHMELQKRVDKLGYSMQSQIDTICDDLHSFELTRKDPEEV